MQCKHTVKPLINVYEKLAHKAEPYGMHMNTSAMFNES